MVAAPQPHLTPDELVRRARALVPLLVEQQDETEARTYHSQEIQDALVDAGLYVITHPRRFGGYEFGLDTFYAVVSELARGCASTGMSFALGAGHTIALAAYWPDDVQEEILSEGPFISPATVKPELVARRVDGGWRLDGTVSFATAAPYANFYWGHALPDGCQDEADMMQVLVPQSEWTLLEDDSASLGLRGSGSPDLRIEDGFVPDRFTMQRSNFMTFEPPDGGTPGATLHGNTLYNGRPSSWFGTEFPALAIGMAKAAVDAYGELMESGTPPFPPILPRSDDYDYQVWYGESVGKVKAAEAVLTGAVRRMQEQARTGQFTVDGDLVVNRLGIETMQLCWDLLHRLLMRTAGTSELRRGRRMERILRDFCQLYFHDGYQLVCETASRDLARVRFGVSAPPAMRTLIGPQG